MVSVSKPLTAHSGKCRISTTAAGSRALPTFLIGRSVGAIGHTRDKWSVAAGRDVGAGG